MIAATIDILTGERIALIDSQHVELGDGDQKITISIRDGVVEISAARTLLIVPRTSNIIRVRSVR